MDYEQSIINYIKENTNYSDEEDAKTIAISLSPKRALDAYLSWEGIIGYTDVIYQLLHDYTPRQLTYIVKYNDKKETKERVFRSHFEYRQFMDKLIEAGYTQKDKTYEHEGFGWVDFITCFEKK